MIWSFGRPNRGRNIRSCQRALLPPAQAAGQVIVGDGDGDGLGEAGRRDRSGRCDECAGEGMTCSRATERGFRVDAKRLRIPLGATTQCRS